MPRFPKMVPANFDALFDQKLVFGLPSTLLNLNFKVNSISGLTKERMSESVQYQCKTQQQSPSIAH